MLQKSKKTSKNILFIVEVPLQDFLKFVKYFVKAISNDHTASVDERFLEITDFYTPGDFPTKNLVKVTKNLVKVLKI